MTIAILMLLFFGVTFPQSPAISNPMAAVAFFEGRWQGTGTGEPGSSAVEREYRFVLGGKFLQANNVSRWAPRDKNPNGEIHEDLGLMDYDTARKTIIFRQFHVEGFVNQYVMEPVQDSKTLVFVSEAIENIAPGWRARETYHVLGSDGFEEVFELAAPGKDFELYSKSHLHRQR